MYIKTCEICGKTFETPTSCRRTCSHECKLAMSKATKEKRASQQRDEAQICEKCQRATGKCIDSIVCPWARALKPVEGWDATPIYIDDTGWSYDIISCPLFLKDKPKKKNDDLLVHWKKLQDIIARYY